jgi:hypothetical protein
MNRGDAGSTHPARTFRERVHWNDMGAAALPSAVRVGAGARLLRRAVATAA